MKKSCPARKVGHTRSRVNFKERSYEKKVDRANSARACSGCLVLTDLTRLGDARTATAGKTSLKN